jgi:hypothetical protein
VIAVAGGILLALALLTALGFVLAMLDTGPGLDISGTDIAITIGAVLMLLLAMVTA